MQFHQIFRGLEHRYGQFRGFGDTNPKTGKKEKICSVPHGDPPYNSHLEGKNKIGIYPFVADKKVAWGCIDIDDYLINIPGIAKQVAELELPGVVCRSTNGGAHIYFFFEIGKEPKAKQLRKKLTEVLEVMGLDPKTEIFPKQNDINIKAGDLGNFVFIPYHGGARHLNYAVNEEGNAIQTIEEFEKYVELKILDNVNQIKVDLKKKPNSHDETETKAAYEYQDQDLGLKEFMDEAPPCLRSILNFKGGFEPGKEGGRNNALTGFAILSKNVKGKAILSDVEEANETFKSPLLRTDLQKIIKSVNSKEYKYMCKGGTAPQVPFGSFCNEGTAAECKTMKYGIGLEAKEKSYFDNFVYVKEGSKVIKLRPTLKELDLQEAKNQMNSDIGKIARGARLVPAGEVWHFELSKRNSVDVVRWHPGKPLFYEEPGDAGNIVKCINVYRPTTRIPLAGDIKRYLDFFKTRIANEEVNKYYHDRIAFLIQYPGERCPVILLFVSDQGGTGKSIIDMIMTELVGVHNISNIDVKSFLSGWGDYFKRKLWIIVEEMYSQGSEKTNLNAALKRYSSMKWASNNGKFQKIGNVDQMFCNFYLTTNKSTAMTVEEGDRRPLIYNFDNDTKKMQDQNSEEGKALYKWCEEEDGYEKILNFYKTRDIKHFEPFKWPPQTEAKKKMMLKTAGFKFNKLYEAWCENRWPFFNGVNIYCPFHLADQVNMDREKCLELMQTHMGIVHLCRAQNIKWVRRTESDSAGIDISHSPENVNLWTTDKNLIGLKPKEATEQYLHPMENKQFGKFFVQDKYHTDNIQKTKTDEVLDYEEHPDRFNENPPF